MCVIFVGMAEVSSNDITVREGQHVKKGDQLGMFHFGGSTHCLIFRPHVKLKFDLHGQSPDLIPRIYRSGIESQPSLNNHTREALGIIYSNLGVGDGESRKKSGTTRVRRYGQTARLTSEDMPEFQPTRKGELFMKKTWLVLFAATVALAGCASNQGLQTRVQSTCTETCKATTEQEIALLFDRWNQSLQTGDPHKVVANYAERSILLPTVSNKPRLTPAEKEDYFHHFLENRPSGRIDLRSIEIGCNTAVDAGLYTFTFAKTGEEVSGRFSFHLSLERFRVANYKPPFFGHAGEEVNVERYIDMLPAK